MFIKGKEVESQGFLALAFLYQALLMVGLLFWSIPMRGKQQLRGRYHHPIGAEPLALRFDVGADLSHCGGRGCNHADVDKELKERCREFQRSCRGASQFVQARKLFAGVLRHARK